MYYGLNALSNNLIMANRKSLKNPNGLFLGTPGSGKSFSAKREIVNVFLTTDDDIIICDPEGEYFQLAEAFKGQVIRISPTSNDHINPLDINIDYTDDDPVTLKSDFILSFCGLIVDKKNGLKPTECTIVDRCVRLLYQDYIADPKPENMPILSDFHRLLLEQNDEEADFIAKCLGQYVTGSHDYFNHRTNVDINNRLVCFDIKEMGSSIKEIGMLIIQDAVWGRVSRNRAVKKSTWYFVDEFHLLLKEPQTAAYSVEIWKRFRKWGGIPTALTQNVKDLLMSKEVENIFENSNFVYMLCQGQGDREILAKRLGISPYQLSYVTNSKAGEGLIFFGSTTLPFFDRFPQDTKLYKIMSTRLSDSEVTNERENN
jgi:type IV secretory pathway VirB4 component